MIMVMLRAKVVSNYNCLCSLLGPKNISDVAHKHNTKRIHGRHNISLVCLSTVVDSRQLMCLWLRRVGYVDQEIRKLSSQSNDVSEMLQ